MKHSNNFISELLVTALISLQIVEAAGLPRHCFIVTPMHGVGTEERWSEQLNDETDLLSDLPKLMAMYEPGMLLDSITANIQPDYTSYISLL